METINIRYSFYFDDGSETSLDMRLDPQSLEMILSEPESGPDWAELDFHQCSHCPLSKQDTQYCPVASNLVSVVGIFDKVLSYEVLDVEVVTAERTVRQNSTAQKAASSLIGLLMGASGCPHTAFFKSMARNHLPLASQEETIFRAASTYLLAQYFKNNDMCQPDFSELNQIYKNIQMINAAVARRLRSATVADSMVNAIAILDLNAQILPLVIEDSLEDVRYLFEPFLNQRS